MTADTITAIKKALEELRQPKSMSMYTTQNDMISDLMKDRRLAVEALESLQRENEELRPYKDELLRLAEAVGEKDDPFAAWEHLEPALARAEAAESEVKRYRAALSEIATNDEYRILTAEEAQRVAQKALASTGGEHHADK